MKGSAKVVLFSVLAVFAVSAALAFAQASAPAQEQLPLQGFLKDSTGKPVTQDLSITFKLYDVETAGTALFNETQTVSVKKGSWYARLGKTAAFPAAVKFDKEYYVELEIGGSKLAPRILVAPGAFVARKSFAVADGSITAAKLADNAVTKGKLADGVIDYKKLVQAGGGGYTFGQVGCGSSMPANVGGRPGGSALVLICTHSRENTAAPQANIIVDCSYSGGNIFTKCVDRTTGNVVTDSTDKVNIIIGISNAQLQ